MIKDKKMWEEFEREIERNTPLNVEENFKIFEAMYQEAKDFGVFPLKDSLEGIEDDIKLARILNGIRETD